MDTAALIKYGLAIYRIKALDVRFEPPEGRVIVRYTDPAGPHEANINFAELVSLLTTSNLRPPDAPPG